MAFEEGSREWFLSLKLDNPDRKKIIANEAEILESMDESGDDIMGGWMPEFGVDFHLPWEEKSNWFNTEHRRRRGGENEEPFLKNFAAHQSKWVKDDDLAELIRVLRQHKKRLSNINKIVCFGLGSPQTGDDNRFGAQHHAKAEAWRSSCQYATALELAKLFKEFNGGKEVQVFAQDPKLTLMEINAFPKLGITIVNPHLHEGFGLIDPSTFVFSICIDFKAKLEHIIMATSQPAGMVFNPDLRPQRLSEAMRTVRKEYISVTCNAFKGQDVYHEGVRIEAPLGPKAKLFILKVSRETKTTGKRKLAETETDTQEGPSKKQQRDVKGNQENLGLA